MISVEQQSSPRRDELLEKSYEYVLEHGLADLSLRPLAAEIGSSPRVLLFLFDSKDGLVRALLARARRVELELLERNVQASGDLASVAGALWQWLSHPDHRALLILWVEGYARSLLGKSGPWAGFAAETVQDWLTLLATCQPATVRRTTHGRSERTAVLALLRGGLIDLLATGDERRVTAAIEQQLARI